MRVKRSTSFMFFVAYWNVEPRPSSVKFVVSTTSVWPSQWPRESPSHWRTVDGRCGLLLIGMIRVSCICSCTIETTPGDCTIS